VKRKVTALLGTEPRLSSHPTYGSFTLYGREKKKKEEEEEDDEEEEAEENHSWYPLPLVFFYLIWCTQ
jgi:hypothetical protein